MTGHRAARRRDVDALETREVNKDWPMVGKTDCVLPSVCVPEEESTLDPRSIEKALKTVALHDGSIAEDGARAARRPPGIQECNRSHVCNGGEYDVPGLVVDVLTQFVLGAD